MKHTNKSMKAFFVLALLPLASWAGPEMTLDTQARAELPNDQMAVMLFVEKSGLNVTELTQAVLATLQKSVAVTKNSPDVDVKVSSVKSYPLWNQRGKPAGWSVRAELALKGNDFTAVGALASKLSRDLALGSLSFTLSPEKRAAEESRLTTVAANSYKLKAQELAGAFGFKTYELKSLNFSRDIGGGPQPQEAGQASGMMAGAAPFPTEGGKSEVSVGVSGAVELK